MVGTHKKDSGKVKGGGGGAGVVCVSCCDRGERLQVGGGFLGTGLEKGRGGCLCGPIKKVFSQEFCFLHFVEITFYANYRKKK